MQAPGLESLDRSSPDWLSRLGTDPAPGAFVSVMQGAIEQVSRSHSQAQAQMQSFRQGQTQTQWEELASSLHRAQAALQEMMVVRDQLVSVYQDLKADRSR
jgi:flagellar hook-basal body complex protein FliE